MALSLVALLALATVINIYRQSTVFRSIRSHRVSFFLVLVSLERAFALIWPLRHRVTSTKVYFYSVAIIWLAGLSLGALNFSATNGVIDVRQYLFAYSMITFLSLFVICSSYLLIRKRLACGTKCKILQDFLYCDRRICYFVGSKHDIVQHQ